MELGGFSNLSSGRLYCSDDEHWDNGGVEVSLDVDGVTTFETEDWWFCLAQSSSSAPAEGIIQTCEVIGYPDLEPCEESEGSRAVTFWVYFAVRTVFVWFYNSVYPLLDSSGAIIAEQTGTTYAQVYIWAQIAATVSPFLSGFFIREPEEGSHGRLH